MLVNHRDELLTKVARLEAELRASREKLATIRGRHEIETGQHHSPSDASCSSSQCPAAAEQIAEALQPQGLQKQPKLAPVFLPPSARRDASVPESSLCEQKDRRHLSRVWRRNDGGKLGGKSVPVDLELDTSSNVVRFKYRLHDSEEEVTDINFEVSVDQARGYWRFAECIAKCCVKKLATGATLKETEDFRDELISQIEEGLDDVPEDSKAWEGVVFGLPATGSPICHVRYQGVHFQTTSNTCGNLMEAARIARLCYVKFEAGLSKEDVYKLRDDMVEELNRKRQGQSVFASPMVGSPTPVSSSKRTALDTLGDEPATVKKQRDASGAMKSGQDIVTPPKQSIKDLLGSASSAPQMPAATLADFCKFLQCQLKKEAQVHATSDIDLEDKGARAMWADYEAFVVPNLGANERWVPYHTVFGCHEKFVLEAIHYSQHGWDEFQRFQAMFIFRAHCKADVFTIAQVPVLTSDDFWKDPQQACEPSGIMETALLKYRSETKGALLTTCFRMIPVRLLEDNDANLVRNIVLRTGKLLALSEKVFPIVKDEKLSAADKFDEISALVQETHGLGETWAKMLTVCIDLAYPELGLLSTQCEVGIGAAVPLRRLLPNGGDVDPHKALDELRSLFNTSQHSTFAHFWNVLERVERIARDRFSGLPLILKQINTERGGLSAATLQVQLCEYRQYRHSLARNRYGLPADESMKEAEKVKEVEKEPRKVTCGQFDIFRARWQQQTEERRQAAKRMYDEGIVLSTAAFETLIEAVGGSWRVAIRVAQMCHDASVNGKLPDEVDEFRESLCKDAFNLKGADDVANDSQAWEQCKVKLTGSTASTYPYVATHHKKVAFQSTVQAAGSIMNAERIARLCFAKLESGATKEEVVEFRNGLYKDANPEYTPREYQPRKRNRSST